MSWTPDLYIGELRPWPDAVRVVRGDTDDAMLYTITPLPHFWTGDGTLHVEAARLPERIDVTLPDERGREVHSARVHRFVSEDAMPSIPMDEMRDFFYRCVPADIERWRGEDFQRVAHFFGAKVVDLREKS